MKRTHRKRYYEDLIHDKLLQITHRNVSYREKGLYDDCKRLEEELIPIFDYAFKSKFEIAKKVTHPAIDIFSSDNKIAIQLSGKRDFNSKIKDTITSFYKESFEKKYEKLLIIFLHIERPRNIISNENISSYSKFKELKKSLKEEVFNITDDIFILTDLTKLLLNSFDINNIARINDILNELDTITGRIEAAYKYSLLNTHELSSINEELIESKNIGKSINTIRTAFFPFNIIPHHILLRLKLFDANLGSHINNNYLFTRNTNLFKYLESNPQSELFKFLFDNQLRKVIHIGLRNEIDLHHSIENKCLVCKHNKAIFTQINPPQQEVNNDNLFDYIKYLYFLVEYQRIEALDVFKSLILYAKSTNNKYALLYFYLMYNFRRYSSFMNTKFFNKKQTEVLKKLRKEVDQKKWTYNYKEIIFKEQEYLKNFFYNSNQFDNLQDTNSIIYEIDKIVIRDQIGYATRVSEKYNEIISWIYWVFYPITHNYLMFDMYYLNASKSINISFKSILNLTIIQNPKSSRIDTLPKWYIEVLLNYGSSTRIKESIVQFKENSHLLRNHRFLSDLMTISTQFLDRIYELKKQSIGLTKKLNYYGGITHRMNSIIDNILTITNYLNFEENTYDSIANQLLKLLTKETIVYGISIRKIFEWVDDNEIKISNKVLKSYLRKAKSYNYDDIDLLSPRRKPYIHKDDDFGTILSVYNLRKDKLDEVEIKQLVFKKLKEKFKFRFYCRAVIMSLVECSSFENEAIDYLKKQLEYDLEDPNNPFGLQYPNLLQNFVEILLSQGVDISQVKYSELIPHENEYFTWLFDPSNYPKEKFTPYWILEYQSTFYYSYLKKYSYIKESMEEYLKENDLPLLSQIYFKYWL